MPTKFYEIVNSPNVPVRPDLQYRETVYLTNCQIRRRSLEQLPKINQFLHGQLLDNIFSVQDISETNQRLTHLIIGQPDSYCLLPARTIRDLLVARDFGFLVENVVNENLNGIRLSLRPGERLVINHFHDRPTSLVVENVTNLPKHPVYSDLIMTPHTIVHFP